MNAFRFTTSFTPEDFALHRRLTPGIVRLWRRMWPAVVFALCLWPSLAILVATVSPLGSLAVYTAAVAAVALQNFLRTRPGSQTLDAIELAPKSVTIDDRGIRLENTEGASEYTWPVLSDARLVEGRLALVIYPFWPMLVPLRDLPASEVQQLHEFIDAKLATSPRFRAIEHPESLPPPVSPTDGLSVTYRNTGAEFASIRFNAPATRFSSIVTVGACFLIIFFLSSIPHDATSADAAATAAAVLVAALMLLGMSLVRALVWRRWFNRGQLLVQTVTIAPEGIFARDAMSAGWLAWSGVGAAIEVDRFLLFLTRRRKLLHLIPKSAFTSPIAAEEFIRIANEYLAKSRASLAPTVDLVNAPSDDGSQADNPYRAPRTK